jgi:transcriptional regulator with XRE-family HTH domain
MAHNRFRPRALRSARLNAGLTAEELACRVDRTASSIRSYEAGTHRPPIKLLVRLADALNIDVGELFEQVEISA